MSLQGICSNILGVISVFQNALIFTLNVSYGAGQLIVSTFIFIATQLYGLLSNILLGIKVMLEDFCVFAFDVFNKISFFCLNLQYLVDSLILSIISCAVLIQSLVAGLFDHISLLFNAVLNFFLKIYNGTIYGFELIKQALILIGTSTWYAIQLIPFCIVYLCSLIVSLFIGILESIHLFIVAIIDCIFLTASNVINFITDIPFESYLGLTFASLITIFSIKYQRLIRNTIAYCFQSSYVSFLRIISKIAVGAQKLKIFITAGNSENMFDEYTIFNWIETFHEKYFSLSLFAKQYYENEEPLSNEELVNRLAREQEQRLCVVCQDKGKNVILMPCRHLCLCQTCNTIIQKRGKKCPICRQTIRRIINVYS